MVTHDFSNPVDRKFSVEKCGQRSSTATKKGTQLQSSFNPAHSVGAIAKGSLNQALWIEHCYPAKGWGPRILSRHQTVRESIESIALVGFTTRPFWVLHPSYIYSTSYLHPWCWPEHFRYSMSSEVNDSTIHACMLDDCKTLYGLPSSRT